MRTVVVFLVGFGFGVVALGVVGFLVAPGLMLSERPSPLGLEETVTAITDAASAEGWIVQSVLPLEKSIKKHGGPEVRPVRLVNLCQAQYAAKIVSDDGARVVSVMMPCTISVYEKEDGTVWIGAMNPGLVGRLFGGVVSEVMAGPVAEAQARFVSAAGR